MDRNWNRVAPTISACIPPFILVVTSLQFGGKSTLKLCMIRRMNK